MYYELGVHGRFINFFRENFFESYFLELVGAYVFHSKHIQFIDICLNLAFYISAC